ncbi:MAG: peptidase S10 [Rubrivivax sp.]|nr:MAG: peptidase S10 [Rubrivivax sp.]
MRATHLSLLIALLLCACGGGGGGTDAGGPVSDGLPGVTDSTVYSSDANASLPGAVEAAAVSAQTLSANGQTLSYTATAGHLIARDGSGAAEASVFYVAYTVPGNDAAARPVTFFYNGGPGSASVWLQLGSYGPKRVNWAGGTSNPLMDNPEHLLGQSDLVFINAVGTGYSQAIAPFSNRSFWSVDKDAELFRDFIQRYIAANNRAASPKYLYGESYGGPRTAVLARRLQEAGVMLDGLVLQSPIMNYNSNCTVVRTQHCAGYLPSYAAVGAWHQLTRPAPTDLNTWAAQARSYADGTYTPAVQAFMATGEQAPALGQPLADLTGLPASRWQASLNVYADDFQRWLVSGYTLDRYDGRTKTAVGGGGGGGAPSPFETGIAIHLRDHLNYRNGSTYVIQGSAIDSWDFSHAGRALPDTVPDLTAALAQNPRLRVLSISGYHDLATPFHVTESDLARVGASRVRIRNYSGGHLSYLDDSSRAQQHADLKAFYADTLAVRATVDLGPERRALTATIPAIDRAGTPQRPGSVAPKMEPAFQSVQRDPWVPPSTPR